VVISTVLLSAVVFSVVGWFLLQQTRDGLLENRVDAVVTEANGGTAAARKLLDSAVGTDSDADTQRQQLAATIIQRGETRGFSAVLFGPSGSGSRIEDGGATFTPGTDTIVPGDTLTKTCVFDLELVGNHIAATLAADSATFTAANGLTAELVPDVAFTIAGDPMPATISDPGSYTIQADISVTFDGAAATNTSQTLQAALDDITVTATQTHDAS
jgi:alternate signal-mediated exported protein